MIASDFQRLPMVFNCCQQLPMITSDGQWLPIDRKVLAGLATVCRVCAVSGFGLDLNRKE